MPYYIKRKKKEKKMPLFDKAGVKIKRKTDLVKKLDKIFSQYIRLRDSKAFAFKAFMCISCGQIKPFQQADCGHYFSRVHMSTRFSELNCHAECARCNRFVADHLIGYEQNLIRKIGKGNFDLLAATAHTTRKWSDFELETMIKYYQQKIKEIQE